MIHKFEKKGLFLVLDVESGTLLEVDELAYRLLNTDSIESDSRILEDLKSEYGEKEVEESLRELESLKENGLLYTKASIGFDDYQKNRNVKALCLHVAHDCNLRCKYCFAGQGDFNGERLLMPLETAKAAIDFVARECVGRRNIEIDFFGGEPLLNFDVVKKTVEYAREVEKNRDLNFHFTITTNGLLLDSEKRAWIDENMDNVVLSIDGREEVNDRMRPDAAGNGSYRRIIDNILEMAKLREGKKDYYVRATYTRENMDFSKDVEHFLSLGLKSLSAEPVVAPKGVGYELRESDVERLKDEYDRLSDLMLKEDFTFFHFNIDLDGGPCLYKRLSGCGAGIDYLAVTPDGDLYPCHQFVSDKDFYLGNVWDGITDERIREKFIDSGIESREACLGCWCRYFCGGGCHANAYQNNGTFSEPYELGCELERARVENALALYRLNFKGN